MMTINEVAMMVLAVAAGVLISIDGVASGKGSRNGGNNRRSSGSNDGSASNSHGPPHSLLQCGLNNNIDMSSLNVLCYQLATSDNWGKFAWTQWYNQAMTHPLLKASKCNGNANDGGFYSLEITPPANVLPFVVVPRSRANYNGRVDNYCSAANNMACCNYGSIVRVRRCCVAVPVTGTPSPPAVPVPPATDSSGTPSGTTSRQVATPAPSVVSTPGVNIG